MNQEHTNSKHILVIPKCDVLPKGVPARDKLATFLYYLALHTAMKDERKYERHYIPFHCNNRLNVLGRYQETIGYAVKHGIVDFNERYNTGYVIENGRKVSTDVPPFTQSFRLTAAYRNGEFRLHEVTHKCSIARLRKQREFDHNKLKQAGSFYASKLGDFSIDPEVQHDESLQGFWDKYTIARWLNDDMHCSRCNHGRLHTLLTQTPKEARKYLRIKSHERLAIVDVSACQPLLLGALAAANLKNQELQSRSHSLLDVVKRNSGRPFARDVQRWIKLCQEKQFYAFIYEQVVSHDGPVDIQIRDRTTGRAWTQDLRELSDKQLKRSCLIPLFDKEEKMIANPIFAIIQRHFPTVASFILRTKRIVKTSKGWHPFTASICQRLESDLMVDAVGSELEANHSHESVATIHDALLLPESFAAVGKSLIESAFNRIDLDPNVETEVIGALAV